MVSSKNGPSSGSGLSNRARTLRRPPIRRPSTATSTPGTNSSATIRRAASPPLVQDIGFVQQGLDATEGRDELLRVVGANDAPARRQEGRLEHDGEALLQGAG